MYIAEIDLDHDIPLSCAVSPPPHRCGSATQHRGNARLRADDRLPGSRSTKTRRAACPEGVPWRGTIVPSGPGRRVHAECAGADAEHQVPPEFGVERDVLADQ